MMFRQIRNKLTVHHEVYWQTLSVIGCTIHITVLNQLLKNIPVLDTSHITYLILR